LCENRKRLKETPHPAPSVPARKKNEHWLRTSREKKDTLLLYSRNGRKTGKRHFKQIPVKKVTSSIKSREKHSLIQANPSDVLPKNQGETKSTSGERGRALGPGSWALQAHTHIGPDTRLKLIPKYVHKMYHYQLGTKDGVWEGGEQAMCALTTAPQRTVFMGGRSKTSSTGPW